MLMDRIEYTIRSFEANRKVALENLAELRKGISELRWLRRERNIRYFLLYPYWAMTARKMVSLAKETRGKISIYTRVVNGLREGNLTLAIEVLSGFCPRPETTGEAIQRIMRNPGTIENVLRSPNILRKNMLKLRDELIALQQ